MLSVPAGRLLTNEGVCEIMQSCFRICFEERLSGELHPQWQHYHLLHLLFLSAHLLELLRCFAEGTLVEMVWQLFSNLSHLKEEETEERVEKECPSGHELAYSKVSIY